MVNRTSTSPKVKGVFTDEAGCESGVILSGGRDPIAPIWIQPNSQSGTNYFMRPKKPANQKWSLSELEKYCDKTEKPDILRFFVTRKYSGSAKIAFNDGHSDEMYYKSDRRVTESKYCLVGLTPLTSRNHKELMSQIEENYRLTDILTGRNKKLLDSIRNFDGSNTKTQLIRLGLDKKHKEYYADGITKDLAKQVHIRTANTIEMGLPQDIRGLDVIKQKAQALELRINDGLLFWTYKEGTSLLKGNHRITEFGVLDLKKEEITPSDCLFYSEGRLVPLRF